jgi:hypothetical protein
MAGLAVASGVSRVLRHRGYEFSVAERHDDADIRRLLRENPTPGSFSLSFEREPSAFDDDGPRALRQCFVVARDRRTGEAIGVCNRAVREAYVDGKVRRLPYLSALRIAQTHRNRIGVLRGGFEALRQFAERPDEMPFALTSIAAENETALRLLSRGIPGLPVYSPVGAYSTFVLGARSVKLSAGIRAATPEDFPAIASFLQSALVSKQFAPHWREEDLVILAEHGLPAFQILLATRNGRIHGCMGVWNQISFKQTVARQYPAVVSALRPLINFVAPFTGIPRLPAIGQPLRLAVLSLVAVENDNQSVLHELLRSALGIAARLGLSGAIFGAAHGTQGRETVRRHFRSAIEYETRLFLAHWPAASGYIAGIAKAAPAPELGHL